MAMAQHTNKMMQKYAQEKVKVEKHSQHQRAREHKQITQIAEHTEEKRQNNAQEKVKLERHSQHKKQGEHKQITQMELG